MKKKNFVKTKFAKGSISHRPGANSDSNWDNLTISQLEDLKSKIQAANDAVVAYEKAQSWPAHSNKFMSRALETIEILKKEMSNPQGSGEIILEQSFKMISHFVKAGYTVVTKDLEFFSQNITELTSKNEEGIESVVDITTDVKNFKYAGPIEDLDKFLIVVVDPEKLEKRKELLHHELAAEEPTIPMFGTPENPQLMLVERHPGLKGAQAYVEQHASTAMKLVKELIKSDEAKAKFEKEFTIAMAKDIVSSQLRAVAKVLANKNKEREKAQSLRDAVTVIDQKVDLLRQLSKQYVTKETDSEPAPTQRLEELKQKLATK